MRRKSKQVLQLFKHVRIPRPMLYGAAAAVPVLLFGIIVHRTQGPLKPVLANHQSVAVTGPIMVELGQDVAKGFEPTIEPAIAGTWEPKGTLLGISQVSFKPKNRLEPGRTYKLRITNLKRVATGAQLPEVDQTFTTQLPPIIKTVTPAGGSKDVATKPRFTVQLSEANRGVRDFKASLSPAVPLKLVSNDDKTLVWEPEIALKQGASYTFILDDGYIEAADKKRLVTAAFTVVNQPVIKSARTGGNFAQGQTVDIEFDQAMEPDATAFAFDMAGQGSWINSTTYRFKPENLKVATTYNYKVKAGLKSKLGGVLESDRPYQFATNGAVNASVSPGGSGVAVNASIRVNFDQAVDHNSAQSRFSISPNVAGKFSWSGNTMTFVPNGLAYQTKYSYAVAPGVAPVWGLPSGRPLGGSFTTVTQVIKLGVPAYKQAYGRSCELSSLRMVLAFRGIKVSDWDILMRVGYNPRPRDGGNWDNPNQMFVGRVDTFSWSQGYGVHAGPIATAAKSYGRNATAHFGVGAAFIAGHIHAGRPVIFYGHISAPKPDSWNTSSGVVQTTTSMHARVVYGVVGSASNPVGFHIIDPWTGGKFYWTAGQLMANMNAALPASNQAVVVY